MKDNDKSITLTINLTKNVGDTNTLTARGMVKTKTLCYYKSNESNKSKRIGS